MGWAERLVVTCEHGGNRVPSEHAPLFRGRERLLESHRGHDPGALQLAEEIADATGCPLHTATVTRLLVDLNRSIDHPRAFSEITRDLPGAAKRAVAARYHAPYRADVERTVRTATRQGHRVLHVSVHSFTPVLRGTRRTADVGILFDPSRAPEARIADEWRAALRRLAPELSVKKNYPYRGWTDGLTTYLRTRFPARAYAGIELEVNQRFPRRAGRAWELVRAAIVESVGELTGPGVRAGGDEGRIVRC